MIFFNSIFIIINNFINKIISNINAFAAFKTAPHIDVKDTYRRSASMLANAISENIKPHVVWSPIPVLVSGEMFRERITLGYIDVMSKS